MTKWDYKFAARFREYNSLVNTFGDWVIYEDGNKLGKADIIALTKKWGEEGWELVAVSPRSTLGTFGPPSDLTVMAGATSDELFIFKRPK